MKLKTRSKGTEQEFVKKLEGILSEPEKLVPECLEKGFMCHFEAYAEKLRKSSAKGSLEKVGRSSDQFLSGIAETKRIVDSGNAPLLGVISTPYGNVDYAKRGDTDPLVLAGIHNFDNPVYRGLAFSALVRGRGAAVYSSSNYYRSTCKGTPPDSEFFLDVLKDEKVQFTENNGDIEVGSSNRSFSIVNSSGLKINVHGDSQGNLYFRLMKHILCKNPEKEFTFTCDLLSDYSTEIPEPALAKYISNQSTDRAFLDDIENFRIAKALARGVSFIGNIPYDYPADFVSAIGTEWINASDLEEFVKRYNRGIRLESPSLRKLLEILWPDFGNEILATIFPGITDGEIAGLRGNPLEKISNYRREINRRKLKESFSGKEWSEDSRFLFESVTTLINDGYEAFLRETERRAGSSMTRKAMVYAISQIAGKTGERAWKYSREETDLGENMIPCLRDVVGGDLSKVNEMISCIKVYVA